MTVAEIVPTSEWLDGKPSVTLPDWRRVVRVFEVDDRYIHCVGWWQILKDGSWEDAPGPGAKRKTRILRRVFERQYGPLEGS